MAQKTALAVYALPGPTHTFVAKSAAAVVLMFRTIAAETYLDGAATSQTYLDGATAGEVYIDGPTAAQTEPS